MIVFVDVHRARFGVAPICRVLSQHGVPIAPSTYYAARSRPRSARSIGDEAMLAEITRVHADPATGPGRARRHRDPPEPAVGGRLHLSADLVGDGVHGVRLRCLQPSDRGVAHHRQHAHRAAAGRFGEGAVDPRSCR